MAVEEQPAELMGTSVEQQHACSQQGIWVKSGEKASRTKQGRREPLLPRQHEPPLTKARFFSPFMTTYSRVSTRGGAIQEQRNAPGDDDSNGDGEKTFSGDCGERRKWWGNVGPVNSFCYFLSLRAGVGLLATSDVLVGIWITFFMLDHEINYLKRLFKMLISQYAELCSEFPGMTNCPELDESIHKVENELNMFLGLPEITVHLLGGFIIVAGVVGLLAVFQNKSTLPARMYMMSWPARFFLRVWRAVWWHSLQNKYGVPRQDSDGTFSIIKTCFLIYSFKVSWAYFKHQLDRKERAHGDRVIRGGSKKAELEEPLIATSIRV